MKQLHVVFRGEALNRVPAKRYAAEYIATHHLKEAVVFV
jgi:hypothetical protein